MSLIQTPWTSQPQQAVGIDWSNPITRGLTYASFDGAGGQNISSVASGSFTKKIERWGVADVFDGSSGKVAVDQSIGKTQDVTVVVLHKSTVLPPNGPTYSHILASTTGSTGADYNGFILMLGNGSAYPQWRVYQGTGVADAACDATSGALNDGKPHLTIATSKGAAGGAMALYVDGRNVASTTHPTAMTSLTQNLAIGYARDAFWGKFQGSIGLVYIFNRALSDAEIRSISANPWQIFRPLPRRIFVPVPAAGGGVTITGNIGDATAAGLTATVSQAASIAAGVGNSAAAGSQASVAQQYTLSAGIGNATAAGLTVTITASGLTTISCTTGDAAAAGSQAVVNSAATVTCSVGNASAAGLTAALDTAYTILANVGNATANGLSATIQAATGISCGVANAIAAGLTASVTNNAALTDSEKIDLILDILSNRQTLDPSTGVYTLYADDGVTILKTAQAWEDAAGTIPYRGRALLRLDAME